MVTTSNPKYSERLKLLRQHAMSINDRVRYESTQVIFEKYLELGYNYRMTDIQASIGIEQLKKLDFITHSLRKPNNEIIFANGNKVIMQQPILVMNNHFALLDACCSGLGVFQASERYTRKHIEEGTLVRLLPEYKMPTN